MSTKSSAKDGRAYQNPKHLANLQTFASNLKHTVNACCPTNDKPYGQVAVLATRWANDDLGVAGLEAELLNVFRQKYYFLVENFIIPANPTAHSLAQKILEFTQKYEQPDGLLIFVYSGHALYSDKTQWMQNRESDDEHPAELEFSLRSSKSGGR